MKTLLSSVLLIMMVACGGGSSVTPSIDQTVEYGQGEVVQEVTQEEVPEEAQVEISVEDTSEITEIIEQIQCSKDEDCQAIVKLKICYKAYCDIPSGKCVVTTLPDGTKCDSSDKCLRDTLCISGECVGNPVICDDNNLCTDDSCDPEKGCVFSNNDAKCDDGNPCTKNDQCKEGICTGTDNQCPCSTDEDCSDIDDDNKCNGKLACDGGFCVIDPTSVITCNSTNPCEKSECEPSTGECISKPLPDGMPCDDSNVCTKEDICKEGVCKGTNEIICDDHNACTIDFCDPKTGGCVFQNFDGQCDDGNPCTENDKCLNGICMGTPSCTCVQDADCVAFEDDNLCNGRFICVKGKCVIDPDSIVNCDTKDDTDCVKTQCNPKDGACVKHIMEDGSPCDDKNLCTDTSVCKDGKCEGGDPISCDDNNICTKDSCDPQKGCVFDFQNDIDCDDGNACTEEDRCYLGVCSGKPISCDDKNPCTDDSCDIVKGCIHIIDNSNQCDDANECTLGDTCKGGQCVGSTYLECDDDNPCTNEYCDPLNGCVFTNNQLPCDDGDACTVGDMCKDGKCVGGEKAVCDDSNPCTDDYCDPKLGCVHTNNNKPCDDKNACTTNDVCSNGKCVGGLQLDCNDNDPCTDDICDSQKGCVTTYNNAPCDDGNLCTANDKCNQGKCIGDGDVNCDDGNVCTDDYCDPKVGCVHKPNNAKCDDGNKCTLNDYCVGGKCVPGDELLVCDDNNPCTNDKCDILKGCVYENNTLPCNDNNACTTGDTCQNGKCVGIPVTCNDNNVCTDDYCDPILGCKFVPNNAPCDDKNKCTDGDKCSDGKCVGGTIITCNDNNVCTADTCIPEVGCVFVNVDGLQCDDGNICTVGDVCKEGKCAAGQLKDCNDGNPCTIDSCDEQKGCVHSKVADNTPCNDGNDCTSNDKCVNGKCVGQGINCDDGNVCTDDKCNPITGKCYYEPNTLPCDDGNLCTINDKCSNTKCVGTPIVCDDKNVCTNDMCDPTTGKCIFQPNNNKCDDGNACTAGDYCSGGKCMPGKLIVCNDDNICTDDYCDPKIGCVYKNNTNKCDDGNMCTTVDVCQDGKCVGTTPPNCDDGNVCTDDICIKDKGCVHTYNTAPCEDGNKCTQNDKCSNGQCLGGPPLICLDDGNQCTDDYCDPLKGCVHPPKKDGTPCDDGDKCTLKDACKEGKCIGVSIICPDDGNQCTDDYCDPLKGCVHPPKKDGTPCDDGNVCTTLDACYKGTCIGDLELFCPDDGNQCTDDYCDPIKGCIHPMKPDGTSCNDGNQCTYPDFCLKGKCIGSGEVICMDDGNQCTDDYCDPAKGCIHPPKPDGTKCNDGLSCTLQDMCSAGFCKGINICQQPNPSCFQDGCKCTKTLKCDPSTANQCILGQCMCGDQPACDPKSKSPYCCPTAIPEVWKCTFLPCKIEPL